MSEEHACEALRAPWHGGAQASAWLRLMEAVADWLSDLALLFEEHKALTSDNEGVVRAHLKASRCAA